MKKLILLSLLTPLMGYGAAHDVKIRKINAGGTAFEEITLADPGADSFMFWNNTTNTISYTPLSDYLTSGDLDSFAELISQVGITGTPDGTKFLRDDGSFQTVPGGGDALVANPLSQFAATTSAQLRGVLSDESGTGVFLTADGVGTGLTALDGGNLQDDTVLAASFADGDWGDVSVATNSVTLDAGVVDTTALGADAVDSTKIADDAIDSEHYTDASIDPQHLSAPLVTFSETFTISEPDAVQGVSDDIVLKKFIAEKYPNGVTITAIHIDASAAYTSETFLFEHWDDAAGTTQATVESITASAISTEDDGTLTDATVPADYLLVLNLDDTPEDVAYVAITISYTVD